MGIEIVQDHECDGDEIGGPISVFWAKGHGYDAREFIRAVVEYCLDRDADVPPITWEDGPVETWQQNVVHQAGVEYRRDATPPKALHSSRFPVTILDLEQPRRRGSAKCSVDQCTEPWFAGAMVRVAVEPGQGEPTSGSPYMAVTLWLCREHRKNLPSPSYRVCLIPVGATILLPEESHD